ncbi:Golgi apparatus membrane protein TVP23 A [Perkinsus olseni]|uniref:Golgi apparatus membrane protein TVP23 A n=1 Tax=Perkinsus olseni TaxID=32597 RepID=A0A7J6MHV9_PEROL|nr:Golgi apparatus membrane protein TVP23 A [Perkinsus olseni]KAF4676255.1 Golgi apparatus membrane protein TVP23 A [Perkinsus olseni]
MTDPAGAGSGSDSQNVRLEFSDFSTSALPPIGGVDGPEVATDTRAGTFSNTVLAHSAHPWVCVFHILFKLAAIFSYWVVYYISGKSYIITFVCTTTCLALDFWTVKNVTGRLLVGLRWWNEYETSKDSEAGGEPGQSTWVFESQGEEFERSLNPTDKTIFWGALYIFPLFWLGGAISNLISLSFDYVVLNIMGLILSFANVVGYWKCSKESQRRLQSWASQQALGAMVSQGGGIGGLVSKAGLLLLMAKVNRTDRTELNKFERDSNLTWAELHSLKDRIQYPDMPHSMPQSSLQHIPDCMNEFYALERCLDYGIQREHPRRPYARLIGCKATHLCFERCVRRRDARIMREIMKWERSAVSELSDLAKHEYVDGLERRQRYYEYLSDQSKQKDKQKYYDRQYTHVLDRVINVKQTLGIALDENEVSRVNQNKRGGTTHNLDTIIRTFTHRLDATNADRYRVVIVNSVCGMDGVDRTGKNSFWRDDLPSANLFLHYKERYTLPEIPHHMPMSVVEGISDCTGPAATLEQCVEYRAMGPRKGLMTCQALAQLFGKCIQSRDRKITTAVTKWEVRSVSTMNEDSRREYLANLEEEKRHYMRLADMCYSRERRRMYDRQYTHLLDRSIAIKKSLGMDLAEHEVDRDAQNKRGGRSSTMEKVVQKLHGRRASQQARDYNYAMYRFAQK